MGPYDYDLEEQIGALADAFAPHAAEALPGLTGIDVPVADVQRMLLDHRRVLGDVISWGWETSVDEGLMNMVAGDLLGQDVTWPLNGDGEQTYEAFRQRLRAAAGQRGWSLAAPAG